MLTRRIRRIGLFALACAVAILIPAEVGAQDSPVLDRIVETSTLRVGMSLSQPPFNMRTRDGSPMGLEVDLANALATMMQVEAQIVEKPFGELIPALERGEIDLVLSGMTITADRSRSVSFIGPYVMSGKSILTKSSTLAAIQNAGELNVPDVRLVALENSTSEQFARRHMPTAELTTVASYDEAVEMLRTDQVGALIADMPICLLTVMRYPNEGFATLDQALSIEPIGMAVSAQDTQLQNLVRNYMMTLEGTGILEAVRKAWMENDAWVAALP